METDISIKTVCGKGDGIKGTFVVGSYQRGYRWDEQVGQLLDDLRQSVEAGTDYYLQPIVLRRREDCTYSLIDGQQRLTTLYILLSFIKREYKGKIMIPFSIAYDTRELTSGFLQNPDKEKANSDIDFFFISRANDRIEEWFKAYGDDEKNDDSLYADKLYTHLCERVKVIWFEDDSDDDETALFTRLNKGRIPLTNAELIKALLLRRDDKWTDERRQNEIAMLWDDIENQFGDKAFWYFLTNDDQEKYPTKIDLLFKIVAKKLAPGFTDSSKDSFATFFHFNQKLEEGMSKEELWDSILDTYLLLREWYDSPATYNKIGFLVACGMNVNAFVDLASKNETKGQFDQEVERLISQRVKTDKPYEELQYGQDSPLISHILLLFNIRSLNKVGQRYDFAKHKAEKWSLEHIHARNSGGLHTVKEWHEWLKYQTEAVSKIQAEAQTHVDEDNERFGNWDFGLTDKMQEALSKGDKLTREEFEPLYDEVAERLQAFSGFGEDIDKLSNLALLPRWQNSVLNNSVFSVKRDKILEMDKAGAFIPLCTRKVFLKYYSASQDTQLAFWSAADRESYLKEIKNVLNIDTEEV